MIDDKKQALARICIGGAIGILVLLPVGGVFNGMVSGGMLGGDPFRAVSPDLAYLVHSTLLAAVIQFALYFALGALAGVATLPFAGDGKTLVVRSLLHFAATAAVFALLSWLCWWCWNEWKVLLVELSVLAAVYVLIWLARWVGWYVELDAIRKKLGLTRKKEGKRREK